MSNRMTSCCRWRGHWRYVSRHPRCATGLKLPLSRSESAGRDVSAVGCIPTKGLLEHAHAEIVQHAKEWGFAWRSGLSRSTWRKCTSGRIAPSAADERRGVPVPRRTRSTGSRGTARLTGRVALTYGGRRPALRARKEIIVATGSAPRRFRIDDRTADHHQTSHPPEEVPKSIVILGSGAVGVEFASIFPPLRELKERSSSCCRVSCR